MINRSGIRIAKQFHVLGKRSLFTVPEIESVQNDKSSGFEGLYTPEGLQKSYYSRANAYVNNLNKESAHSDASLEEILSKFHNEPNKRDLFENASYLYNMKFSMDCLAPTSSEQSKRIGTWSTVGSLYKTADLKFEIRNAPSNEALVNWIEHSFGSVMEFKTLLINTANAVKGDGFVWLVAQANANREDGMYENLFLLNTFGPGQPSSNMAQHLSDVKQRVEANAKAEKEQANEGNGPLDSSSNNIYYKSADGSIASIQEAESIHYREKSKIVPIFAIDASPKAYLYDYGVYGKKRYLENVWNCIDWNKVAGRLPHRSVKNIFEL